MKFSVLMSVYFKENPSFFDLALKSNLTEQSVKPDEFVLVCDGKLTDELDEVIEKYKKEYPEIFFVYRINENVGLGAALNFGLGKCSNEIVARSDSDDICDKYRFEKQINYLKKNPEISAVGTAIDEFNENVSTIINIKHMPEGKENILKVIVSRNPINHMTVMFKKTDVIKVGSYISLPYLEDYYLWARLVGEGYNIDNINDILVHARIGNGMVKRRGNKQYIKSWKTLDTYMIEKRIISRRRMMINMFLIRFFVAIPDWSRALLYKCFLRNL